MSLTTQQKVVVKALRALTPKAFLNVYEWVCNGHPLATGPQVEISAFVKGKP